MLEGSAVNKVIYVFLSSFLLSIILVFVAFREWSLYNWNEVIFYIGLILMTSAAIFFVLAGQFFSAFHYSVKRFFALISKREHFIRTVENSELERRTFHKQYPSPLPCLMVGSCYCLVSFIFSFFLV